MNRTEQQTDKPSCRREMKMGGFRRLVERCTVAAAMAVAASCLMAIGAVPARAEDTHLPLFQLGEVPAEGPHGEQVAIPGPPVHEMESLTVDSGHVWLAEGTIFGKSRVDEFDAKTGAFIAQPMHLETPSTRTHPTCYGYGCGEGVAVGHGPGEAAVYVAGENNGESVVSVFNEAGILKTTWKGAATPAKSFGVFTGYREETVGTITDVAVDNSTDPLDPSGGDVFVEVGVPFRAPGDEQPPVIDIFHPEADGEERYVGQITGPSPSKAFTYIPRMAVDEANGDLFVTEANGDEKPAVSVFEPSGLGSYTFVHVLNGPPPTGAFHSVRPVAVDSATGEVYVKEPGGSIDQFSAAGVYLGRVENSPETQALAVDPESPQDLYTTSVVYGPNVLLPDVTTAAASDLKPESVTLTGTVNPDGAGKATCEFEWGTSTSFGKTTPCSTDEVPNGEEAVPVYATLGGLERDTTYYYRLRASNANGTNSGEAWQDEQFSTHGVLVREEFVSDVAATSATFGAAINPGQTYTSYYFEYGTGSGYGQDLPVLPGEAIGSGTADVVVPGQHVQGLSPSTTYHYRVVAVSEVKPGESETFDGADHTFITQAAGGAFALADSRQWELVSPTDKLGALIEGISGSGIIQASADGGAIAYRTSSPTEGEPPGYAVKETVLSMRGDNSWSSRDISVPHSHAPFLSEDVGAEFQAFSDDLSRAAVRPIDSVFTPLSPEASETTAYLRTDYQSGGAEAYCSVSCYRPLVTSRAGFADVPPGTAFGGEPDGFCEDLLGCGPYFQGASPDLSHVVLSSSAQLTSTPVPAGGPGLYEWAAGHLQLIGLLPKGEEGPVILAGEHRENGHRETAVRHAISDDGERVLMEGGATGGKGLYVREVGVDEAAGETVRLDVPQGGSGPSEGMSYMTASSDGSRIFFLDRGHLTAKSSAFGEDLYEYDLNAPPGSRLTDLTADPNGGEGAGVEQVLGASEDGSYIYFVATGVLAEGASRAGQNVYVRHEGATRLVAVLSAEDYVLYDFNGQGEKMLARVSPNGIWLAFMSNAELTGYDTHDAVSGHPDEEVYLYDAAPGGVVCASCDPTGARPVGAEVFGYGGPGVWVAASVPSWNGPPVYGSSNRHQPRYLSDSGRLFFDSSDALVPQDVDGVEDVYEYEPASVGNCVSSGAAFVRGSSGCLNLVSAGVSPAASEFLDASETGGDVFFRTSAQLVSQDYDSAYDVYDAHECTSAAPCFPVVGQSPACETEASCRTAPTPQPALYGAPASATFSGTGNTKSVAAPVVKAKAKTLSRAQRLAAALKVCRKKPRGSRRMVCERRARKSYGPTGKAKKSNRRSK